MSQDYTSRRQQHRTRARVGLRLIWFVLGFSFGYITAVFFDFNSLVAWLSQRVSNQGNQNQNTEIQKTVKKEVAPVKPKFEFYTLLSKDDAASLPSKQELKAESLPEIESPPKPLVRASTEVPSTIDEMPTTGSSTIVPATSTSANLERTKAPLIQEKKPELPPTKVTSLDTGDTGTKPNKPSHSFVIQIAAFNKAKDAERLKAMLTLTGFNASISTIQRQSVLWYRVSVGPFASLDEAKKAQVSVYKVEHMRGIIRQVA